MLPRKIFALLILFTGFIAAFPEKSAYADRFADNPYQKPAGQHIREGGAYFQENSTYIKQSSAYFPGRSSYFKSSSPYFQSQSAYFHDERPNFLRRIVNAVASLLNPA